MQAYIDSLAGLEKLNPRIWSLKAEIIAERGYSAWLEQDYPAAIKYYTDALSFGDRLQFLKIRGKSYMQLKQYDAAKRDFLRLLEYSRADQEITNFMSFLEHKK